MRVIDWLKGIFGREVQDGEKLDRVLQLEEKIMIDVTKLQKSLTDETNATVAATNLMVQLSAAIKNANSSGDQAAVDALADQISANAAGLAASVVANTPADPNAPAAA